MSDPGLEMVGPDPMLDRVIGDCKLIKKLGHGGMGDVYLAEHQRLHKHVAIKILPPEYSRNEELILRFKREAVAAARLEHRNIISIHDVNEDQGFNFIVMQFVEGESLQDRLDRSAPLDLKEATLIIRAVASGLRLAHREGIVHRDIKPANILISNRGEVKLTDFGLAHDADSGSSLTMSGVILGTPHFLSPEQAEGRKTDGRADIYSLGVTYYYAITGGRPFLGESNMAILYRHVNEPPTDPRRKNPKIPKQMAVICLKMLQKKPESRYQSCGELIEDIDKFIRGEQARTGAMKAVEKAPPRSKGTPAPVRKLEDQPRPEKKSPSPAPVQKSPLPPRRTPTPAPGKKQAAARSHEKGPDRRDPGTPSPARRRAALAEKAGESPLPGRLRVKKRRSKWILVGSFSMIALSIVGMIVAIVMTRKGPAEANGGPADPGNARVQELLALGVDLEEKGRIEPALAALAEAARIEPGDEQVLSAVERLNYKVEKQRDEAQWARVQDARPDERPGALQNYVDNFPDGEHAAQARQQLSDLASPGRVEKTPGTGEFFSLGGTEASFRSGFAGCGHVSSGVSHEGEETVVRLSGTLEENPTEYHVLVTRRNDVVEGTFRCDIKIEKGWVEVIAREAAFRDPIEPDHQYTVKYRPRELETGKWHLLSVSISGADLEMRVDGKAVLSSMLDEKFSRFGRFGFRAANGVTFRIRKPELSVISKIDVEAVRESIHTSEESVKVHGEFGKVRTALGPADRDAIKGRKYGEAFSKLRQIKAALETGPARDLADRRIRLLEAAARVRERFDPVGSGTKFEKATLEDVLEFMRGDFEITVLDAACFCLVDGHPDAALDLFVTEGKLRPGTKAYLGEFVGEFIEQALQTKADGDTERSKILCGLLRSGAPALGQDAETRITDFLEQFNPEE